MKQFSLALVVLLVACGGTEAAKPVAPRADSAPRQPSAVSPTDQPAAPSKSASPLALALSVERTHDGLGLHVINRGSSTVSLSADVALEKKSGQAYGRHVPQALKLRFDCKSQGCVSLAPGAELLAPAWLGRPDSERCDRLVPPPEAGSYRFIVRSCPGSEQAELAFVAAAEAHPTPAAEPK